MKFNSKNATRMRSFPNNSVTCIAAALATLLTGTSLRAQTLALNSQPSITSKVIYLDFDGQVVSGTSWNSGNTINASASGLSNSNKIIVWKRVSEDYRPFDVNVTTEESRFNAAPANKRIRVIVTPTSQWYGSAGGVAFVGSFAWGGTPGTPCWVFENQLGMNAKSIGEAASHEVGHSLSLRHQSTYDASCNKTNEYHPGLGTGMLSWAPIMGVGYNRNVTTWFNGKSALSCNTIQYDHSNGSVGITGVPYLAFLPDDVGDNFPNAKFLNLNSLVTADSGIITTPADLDAYRFTICQNRYVTLNVKPWALDTNSYPGANLDVRLHLYNATTSSLIAVDTSLTRLHSRIGVNLAPGSYYFTIDGGRAGNYSDYGSLGRYYVDVRATNPPSYASGIVSNPSVCQFASSVLSSSSTSAPSSWQWTVSSSAGNTLFTVSNPNVTFGAPGTYTVQLITSNGNSTSCPFTSTMSASAAPSIAITGASQVHCAPASVNLSGNGATSYTWLPGNLSGSQVAVTPSNTITYTVQGANGGCTGLAYATVSVVPMFTVTATASKTLLCEGESFTLTAGGANNYTIGPNSVPGPTVVYTPTANTNYLVFGEKDGCLKATSRGVTVIPAFTVALAANDSNICAGEQVTLTLSGANSYTVNPGGFTGSMVQVMPFAPTLYTLTGVTQSTCSSEAYLFIEVNACDVSLSEIADGKLVIFPNPAAEKVFVSGVNAGSATLYDQLGRRVAFTEIENGIGQLSVSGLPKGMYTLQLLSGSGGLQCEKLCIE
jgi:hypothetical protein